MIQNPLFLFQQVSMIVFKVILKAFNHVLFFHSNVPLSKRRGKKLVSVYPLFMPYLDISDFQICGNCNFLLLKEREREGRARERKTRISFSFFSSKCLFLTKLLIKQKIIKMKTINYQEYQKTVLHRH